jgi:SOS-response transcriptional repressor LexA
MQEIILKIKNEMKKQGLSEKRLGDKAGLTQNKVHRIIAGETQKLDIESINRLNEALGIASDPNAHPAKLVPVFGNVPAGWPDDQPEIVGEEPLDWIPIEGSTHGIGALRVEGHSMSPEIRDGMYVLYTRDYDIKPGDVIVATDEYNRAMVKQYALKDGEPWLISINPEYPSFKVNSSYRIVGRVFEKYDKSRVGRGR